MSYQALLFCPEEKTARVVTQVLTELDFTVELCNEPFAAVKKLMAQHFDAVVVDCDNEQNAMLLFKSARNSGTSASSLSVAVVEGQSGVAKAFRIGANLVLTKPINVEQSKGTLRVARGLLRKAEITKPATGLAPTAPATTAAPKPAPFNPPTSFTAAPAPPPAIPAPLDSVFEVEQEPEPKLEPTEAAFLESMPDPSAKGGLAESGQPKEFPWQPASRTAEPMATAIRRAAAAVGQASAPIAPSVETSSESNARTSEIHPLPSASAIEAKPGAPRLGPPSSAKTKDDLAIGATELKFSSPALPEFEKPGHTAPTVEPPQFAALAVKDHEGESEEEGKRRSPLVAVVVVLGLVAAGYYGYTKLYPTTPQSAAPRVTAPIQSAPPVPAPQPAPATSPAQTQKPSASTPSPAAQVDQTPAEESPANALIGSTSTALSKGTAGASTTAKPTPTDNKPAEHAPLVIKNDFSKPAKIRTTDLETGPPQVAPAVEITGSSDAAIAGIVSTKAVNMPKPAPQTLHVSQGVSQGLLFKRVQPVYPESARQMRVQGAVEMQANITKDGNISNVKVLSGDQVLAKAAVAAVKQWKYKPYYLNGDPIEIQTQITVNFKLPQ